VRLPVQAGALAAPMPIAIHYLAKAKLKARKVKKQSRRLAGFSTRRKVFRLTGQY
jgi:hypothetical protein